MSATYHAGNPLTNFYIHFLFHGISFGIYQLNKTKEVSMNRIFTLITFLFASIATFANFNEARLSISSMSNTPIRVLIDGRQVQQGNKEFRISNLSPGNHRIQIYRVNQNQRRGVFGSNNRDELIYNGNVNLRRGTHTDIVINRFGKVFTDEQRIDNRYDDTWSDNDWNNDRNNDNWNRDNDNWNRDNNNSWGQPMNYERFQQLKQSIERESFDKNKMDLLRSILPNNRVTAQQVRELAYLISFEQTRLELAKFAYRYTSDRGNYFVVNDVFNFGSSKTELTRYISNYRD
jgi:hypothetical protein